LRKGKNHYRASTSNLAEWQFIVAVSSHSQKLESAEFESDLKLIIFVSCLVFQIVTAGQCCKDIFPAIFAMQQNNQRSGV